MGDEALWQRRFLAFTAVRLFGLGVFFLGLVIASSDLVREGGWPLLGGIIAVAGGIDAVFAPRMLKKLWEQQDGATDNRADR